MKNKIIVFVMTAVCAIVALAGDNVGTVTQSKAVQGPVVKNTFLWVSGTNNNSVASTVGTYYVRGELLRVVFIPSLTAGPAANYTVTLTDENGIDVLAGKGAVIVSNTVSSIRPGIAYPGTTNAVAPYAVNDLLTVAVTNCGNSTSGRIVTYTR